VFVREYIGEDLRVSKNRKLRDIRDRFVKLADERILITSYSPLTLVWKDSYKGGDIPAADTADDRVGDNYEDSLNNKTGQEQSTGKVPESDTSDTSDSDKGCNGDEENGSEVVPDRTHVPSFTPDKDIMSDVTHVTHVTSTQTDATNFSCASDTINAEGTVVDSLLDLSEKERDRCKQTSLTDGQIIAFYQVFNELENESNLQPCSFSSDDKGTIGGEELTSRLVPANDADWLVKEMQRIGNIRKVAFDTFRRAI
jgi:hypothetical protein